MDEDGWDDDDDDDGQHQDASNLPVLSKPLHG